MNDEMRMMLNAVLEEIGRLEQKMDLRLERIENEIEQLHHEVNACKLEKDAVQLLIHRQDRLEEHQDDQEARILRLERKQKKNQGKKLGNALNI